MPPRKKLSVVGPEDAAPAPVKAKSLVEAAESGSHRELLVAMRSRLAQTISNPSCPPRDLAALTRRLQDIAKEIESIDARESEEAGEGVVSPDEAFDASAI